MADRDYYKLTNEETCKMDNKLQSNVNEEVENPGNSVPTQPPGCIVCATTIPEPSFIYTTRTKLGKSLLDFVQKFVKPGWKPEHHSKSLSICKSCFDAVNKLEEAQMKVNAYGDESTDSDSDSEKSKISKIEPNYSKNKPIENSIPKTESLKRPISKVEPSTNDNDVNPQEAKKELKAEDDSKTDKERIKWNTVHKCDNCSLDFFRFSYGKDLTKDNRFDEPIDCLICQRLFMPRPSKKRKPLTDNKPFGCNICKSRFKKEESLGPHMKSHTRERPYECHACDLKFEKRPQLLGHLKACNPCICGIKCFQVLLF